MDNTVAAMPHYIAAFVDANLKGGVADPLLRGPSADYPDVEVTPPKQHRRAVTRQNSAQQ